MRQLLISLILVLAIALPAHAKIVEEGWEGTSTVLGMAGAGVPPIIAEAVAGTPVDPQEGTQLLLITNNSPTGTPEAYIAWIKGLEYMDIVQVCVWRYDDTPDGTTPFSLWAHWNDDELNIGTDSGDAYGNENPGPGIGWEEVCFTWAVEGPIVHTGLVVKLLLNVAEGESVHVDGMTVTAPDEAAVLTTEGQLPVEKTTWSAIKAMYK